MLNKTLFMAFMIAVFSMVSSTECRKSRSSGRRRGHHYSSHRSGYRAYRGGWRPAFFAGGYYDPYIYDYGYRYPYAYGYDYDYVPYAYEPAGSFFGFNFSLRR